MADQNKPDPIEDVRAGFGLLLRAAKTAVARLETTRIEDAVKEVGRAIENVADSVMGSKGKSSPPPPSGSAPEDSASAEAKPPTGATEQATTSGHASAADATPEPKRGPRVDEN